MLPLGNEEPENEPNNWRWLDLIDHLKIKVKKYWCISFVWSI